MILGNSICNTVRNLLWYDVYGNVKDDLKQVMNDRTYIFILVESITRDYVGNSIDEIAYLEVNLNTL